MKTHGILCHLILFFTFSLILPQAHSQLIERVGNVSEVHDGTADKRYADVASNKQDLYVIVWDQGDNFDKDVYFKLFNNNGALTNPIRVNQVTAQRQGLPKVAMNAQGNFVVVWQSFAQDGSDYGVYARRFNAAGNPLGDEFQVNTATQDFQGAPDIAMYGNGNYIITWQSFGQDGSGFGIYAQKYTANGNTSGNEFRVNSVFSQDQKNPSVSGSSQGFVIVWDSKKENVAFDYDIFAQRYNNLGEVSGANIKINTLGDNNSNPDVALNENGIFVVAWKNNDGGNDRSEIYARSFNANGTPVNADQHMNIIRSGDQEEAVVYVDEEDYAIVAWTSDIGAEVIDNNILARVINPQGVAIDNEYTLNGYTDSDQIEPAFTMISAGTFVTAWIGRGELNLNSRGLYYQKFTFDPPNVTAITPSLSNQISIYPNPSEGVYKIQMPNLGLKTNYELFNNKGKLVSKGVLREEIDIQSFPKGLYLLKMKNDHQDQSIKLIKH